MIIGLVLKKLYDILANLMRRKKEKGIKIILKQRKNINIEIKNKEMNTQIKLCAKFLIFLQL